MLQKNIYFGEKTVDLIFISRDSATFVYWPEANGGAK